MVLLLYFYSIGKDFIVFYRYFQDFTFLTDNYPFLTRPYSNLPTPEPVKCPRCLFFQVVARQGDRLGMDGWVEKKNLGWNVISLLIFITPHRPVEEPTRRGTLLWVLYILFYSILYYSMRFIKIGLCSVKNEKFNFD